MKGLVLGLLLIGAGNGLLFGQQAEGSFDRSLNISGNLDLDVQTDSGGISVRAGAAGTVRIHAILKAQHGWFGGGGDPQSRIRELERNPPVEQTGSSVRVGYVHDRDLLKGISMRFEIEAPANTRLRARAESGGIEVEGIRDSLDCKTDSGGIEIRDAGSDVHAEADSGGIHIRNAKGSVFARADSGGIEAINVGGALDVQSDSGHMRLSQTAPARINASANSGGIDVTLAPGAGYDIDAQTDSGGLSVPEMTVSSRFSNHHMEGKVRGGGPTVTLRADSGGITVN